MVRALFIDTAQENAVNADGTLWVEPNTQIEVSALSEQEIAFVRLDQGLIVHFLGMTGLHDDLIGLRDFFTRCAYSCQDAIEALTGGLPAEIAAEHEERQDALDAEVDAVMEREDLGLPL